jgi:hypothetical protein
MKIRMMTSAIIGDKILERGQIYMVNSQEYSILKDNCILLNMAEQEIKDVVQEPIYSNDAMKDISNISNNENKMVEQANKKKGKVK